MLPDGPSRHLFRFASALTALALFALPATAFELTKVAASRDEGGQLWVHAQLMDPLETRIEQSLSHLAFAIREKGQIASRVVGIALHFE